MRVRHARGSQLDSAYRSVAAAPGSRSSRSRWRVRRCWASEFGSGQVFWSMLWFFLFFIWIWILITVFADIFRSHDLSGWAKALWVIFVIFVPYLGVFVYLIARGHKMSEHAHGGGAGPGRRGPPVHPGGGRHGAAARPTSSHRLADLKDRGRHRRRRVPEAQGQGRQLTDPHPGGASLRSNHSRRSRVRWRSPRAWPRSRGASTR